jgi:thiol-disulfide isomerase/thioredoxin
LKTARTFLGRAAFAGLLAACSAGRAQTWRPADGPPIEGQLSGVFGAVAFISGAHGTGLVPLNKLDDASLNRVADFMERSPQAAQSWAKSQSKVAAGLRRRLQVLQDGKMVEFDPGARAEPEIYLVYFGAHWCPPCRAFSPTLLERYRQLKQEEGDRLEVVFVSDDRSHEEQVDYVKWLGMPWPVLKYSEIGNVPAVEHADGPAIPDLVLLTRDGNVIFDSFHGAEYEGPQSVLDDTANLLAAMHEGSPACRVATHRLSVIRYVRASSGGTRGPQPYLIALDPSHYQSVPSRRLEAIIDIDERGRVTGAKADPELPTALEFQFEQDALNWLFLPSVSNGQAKAVRVKLPIKF